MLDVDSFDLCIAADKDWAHAKAELQVVGKSFVGQRVIAMALWEISAGVITERIDEAVKQVSEGSVR